jgi:hypothetical protein
MLGAVVGFALVGLAGFGGLRARVALDARQPVLWNGLQVLSIGLAIAAATVIAHLLENLAAWLLGGFAATAIYLAVLAVQFALAR